MHTDFHIPAHLAPEVQAPIYTPALIQGSHKMLHLRHVPEMRHSGRSLTEKKKVFRYQFSQKSPRALLVLNHGWWRLAVGGWRRLAVGSWQLAVGGGWWWLAAVGG